MIPTDYLIEGNPCTREEFEAYMKAPIWGVCEMVDVPHLQGAWNGRHVAGMCRAWTPLEYAKGLSDA